MLRGQVLKLQKPSDRALRAFSNWFNTARPFVSYKKSLLDEQHDFVALGATEEQDRLSRIILDIGERCLPGLRNFDVKEVQYYYERMVQKLVAGISIIMAALLLEGAITTLYLVTNPHVRPGLTALFMVLFAGGIGLSINAKRSEMFAATAAYAAVLVVFVSGNLGGGS